MNRFTTQLQKQAETIALTEGEKFRMRSILAAHMRAHPLKKAVPSPYSGSLFMMRMFLVPALCLVVLFGGVAYAAEGTLPGDLLYGFRVHVNESMKVTLALSASKKAEVEVQIANRRVSEAQELEAQGALTSVVAQQLENNFNTHAKAALLFATMADEGQKSGSKKNDPAVATTTDRTSGETEFSIRGEKGTFDAQTSFSPSVSAKVRRSLSTQAQFFDAVRLSLGVKEGNKVKNDDADETVTPVVVDKHERPKVKTVKSNKKFMNANTPGPITNTNVPTSTIQTSASSTEAASTTTPISNATTTATTSNETHSQTTDSDSDDMGTSSSRHGH